MIIKKENIESIKELYLHDMKLLDIKIEYCNHNAMILLCDEPKKKNHRLLFKHIQSFSIERFEPWGEGVYLSQVTIADANIEEMIKIDEESLVDKNAFLVEILINSGDKIKILSSEVLFE